MLNKNKILVIGAGPAGLSVLKALRQLKTQNKTELVCIQKQDKQGGQWNYTSQTNVDKYGENIDSSMYSQLWTNIPKQCFEYNDYTFQQHFKKPVPSYLPRQIFKGYFMKRFEKYQLNQYIKFNHVVKNIKFLEKQKKFEVNCKDLTKNQSAIDYFDYVTVATGHFTYPNFPKLKGLQKFRGKAIHSHSVRQFNQFKDKNILIIGGGPSGQDLSVQLYKFGSKNVIWTYQRLRLPFNQRNFPKNIELIPSLAHVDEQYAYFYNGKKRQIDVIIFATGYLHNFPFLQQNLQLKSKNILFPQNLYKGVVWHDNPRLFYVGMGSYICIQTLLELQAYLIKDIITGNHHFPNQISHDLMDLKRQQSMTNIKCVADFLKCSGQYIEELMILTQYPRFDPYAKNQLLIECFNTKLKNLLTYRDIGHFKSIYTGQISCLGKKPWLEVRQSQFNDKNYKRQISQFFQF